MKLRVGIVGLSDDWDSRHRPALRTLSDKFELRAVCSEVAVRAQQVAREFDAAHVDGFRELCGREDIDAVMVLSPEWFGILPILAACDAGKAVYCATPLDLSPETARQLQRRVQESGVAFTAEFPRRHAAATVRLKELIATRLGQPRLLFCHHRLSVQRKNRDRSGSESAARSRSLLELVDWCRYIVGSEPTSVMGVVHRPSGRRDLHDYQMMNLDFSTSGETGTGPMAQISCGHYMPSTWTEAISFRPPAALQVVCENGVAFVDLPHMLTWFDQAGRQLESLEHERPVGEQLLLLFHRTVTSLVQQTSCLEDTFRTLAVVRAARESGETGRRIPLDFADP